MFKVSIHDMIIYRGVPSMEKGIIGAFHNHFSGRGTMSEGKPLIVRYIQEEKKYIILDGYHRIVKGLLEGKTEFDCVLDWFNEEKWWVPTHEHRFVLEELNDLQRQGADDAVSRWKESDIQSPKALRGLLMDLVPDYDPMLINALTNILFDFGIAKAIVSGDDISIPAKIEQAKKIYQDDVVNTAVSIFDQDGGVSIGKLEPELSPVNFDEPELAKPTMQKARLRRLKKA